MATIDDLLRGIREAGEAPFRSAIAIPNRAYNSQDLFDLEAEHLFRRGWTMIARVEQAPTPNSYHSVDLLGELLVMTRDKEGVLHVFSRVCPHRGAELLQGSGKTRAVVCPYHAWTFDLAGQCRGAPLMDDLDGFDRQAHGLRPIRHEVWNGFVFVNLDGAAPPLTARLKPLDEALADCELSNLVVVKTLDWGEVPYDWKVIAENSMECYHHHGVHIRSIGKLFPANRSWTVDDTADYLLTYSEPDPDEFDRVDGVQTVVDAARIVTVFPYGHFTARPTGGTFLQVLPVAAGRSRVFSHMMLTKAAAQAPGLEELIASRLVRTRQILGEDWAICEKVQAGALTTQTHAGRLSSFEHPLWLFYRYYARALPTGAAPLALD
jgi:phenylpropionate dioxygenase-like ring-hydroxylating dioxygenase large terminal subunit